MKVLRNSGILLILLIASVAHATDVDPPDFPAYILDEMQQAKRADPRFVLDEHGHSDPGYQCGAWRDDHELVRYCYFWFERVADEPGLHLTIMEHWTLLDHVTLVDTGVAFTRYLDTQLNPFAWTPFVRVPEPPAPPPNEQCFDAPLLGKVCIIDGRVVVLTSTRKFDPTPQVPMSAVACP